MFGGILDLPDELADFQDSGGFENLPELGGQLSNNTSVSSIGNAIGGPPGNPGLARVGGGTGAVTSHVNFTQKSNMTPPPNAIISTSGDPTPTLPSISSSPIHSSPATISSVSPYTVGGVQIYQQPPNSMQNIGMSSNIHSSGMNPHIDPRVPYNNPHYNPGITRGLRFPGPSSSVQLTPPPHPVNSIGEFSVVRHPNSSIYQPPANPQHMNFNPNLGLQNANQIHNKSLQGTVDQLSQQQQIVSQAQPINQQVWIKFCFIIIVSACINVHVLYEYLYVFEMMVAFCYELLFQCAKFTTYMLIERCTWDMIKTIFRIFLKHVVHFGNSYFSNVSKMCHLYLCIPNNKLPLCIHNAIVQTALKFPLLFFCKVAFTCTCTCIFIIIDFAVVSDK